MKIIIIFLIINTLQIFISCQNNYYSTLTSELENIDINPNDIKMENAFASKYIDSCQYIPLESSDSVMIGSIKQIFEDKDRFYIHDTTSDIIFIFDKTGKYLTKIDRKGRGNDEYIKLTEMYLDPINSEIIILCDRSQSLIRYDCNGNFIKRTENKFITSALASINSDTIITYAGRLPNESMFSSTYPYGYLVVIMHNGKIINKFLENKFDPIYLNYVSKTNYFFNFSDTLSLIEDFSNTIYRIVSSSEIKPRYSVTFGKYTLPMNFNTPIEKVKEIISTYKKNPSTWCDIEKVIEKNNILLFHYYFGDLMHYAIYIKSQKQIQTIGPIWVNDIDGIGMPTICNSSLDNTLIGFIESHIFIDLVKISKKTSSRVINISQKLTEMDNPVLVKVFLKQNIK